jgi:hypothetical protein
MLAVRGLGSNRNAGLCIHGARGRMLGYHRHLLFWCVRTRGSSRRSPPGLSQPQPRNDGVMAVEKPGQSILRTSRSHAAGALCLLMLGGSERTEECQDALTHGAGQVQIGLFENLQQCCAGGLVLNDLEASSIDRVARSHAGSTSTSPVRSLEVLCDECWENLPQGLLLRQRPPAPNHETGGTRY